MKLHLFKKLLLVRCKVDVLLSHGLARALANSLHLLQLVQQLARAVGGAHLRLLAAPVAGKKKRNFSGLESTMMEAITCAGCRLWSVA